VKVSNEKTENSQVFLTIEMEPAEVEESLAKSYSRLVQRTKIPGFRKGKAPRAILERYLGREGLLEDALNDLVPQAYEKAIQEQEIEAIAQPQIEVTQTEPLVFKAVVPLKPEISLGDYRQIRLTPEAVTVTEDNVNEVIEQLRHQHATWEPVERPVDFSDLLVLNVEGIVEDEPFIKQEGAQYQVIRDQPYPAPGFAEQLAGMKRDEEKEFQAQLPEDYPRNELAGKEARFKVKIGEIKQEVLPELNAEFAQGVNPDFKTLDLLREQVSSELQNRAEDRARADFEERVIDALVELSSAEFPPVLIEMETDRILNQRFQRGAQQLEEYLGNINKTEEELREEIRPTASSRVMRSLLLGKVVESEKIEVSDAEIDTEIENIVNSAAENKGGVEKVLNTPQARESIGQTLISRKAMERLVEIAKTSEEIKTQKEEGK